MTPDERDLVDDLFDRLASLENAPRDPQAESVIAEGLERAPNAIYPLVQTVLVQDEALRQAEEHIRQLEAELGYEQPPQQQGGFLDSMRDALFGRPKDERPRGSVPSVRPGDAPMGAPSGFRTGAQPAGESLPQQPDHGRGGSFLGTAAATAVGVIGGSLLLQSMGSLFGQGKAHAAYDADGGRTGSPWGGDASGSDLARQAGVDDIGRGAGTGGDDRGFGLFDTAQNETGGDDFSDLDDGDFDVGGGDE